MQDSRLLDGDVDTTTWQDIPAEEMQNAFESNYRVLEFFHAIDTKLITLTLTDYVELPQSVLQAWQIWNAQKKKEGKKR